MNLPEIIYSIFQRAKGRPPYPFIHENRQSSLSLSLSDTFTVPADSDAIIQTWYASWDPGGALTLAQAVMHVMDPLGRIAVVYEKSPGTSAFHSPDGAVLPASLYLQRGSRLECFSIFSAATSANAQNHFVSGILIPPMDL